MENIKNLEHLKNIIMDSGLRLTPQRMAILNVLFTNKNRHLTVEEIYFLSKCTFPKIGVPTVYRAVLELERIGVLYKVTIYGGSCKYQLIVSDEKSRHRHFICTQCGSITDIDSAEFGSAEQQIENRYNISIESQSSIYYGLCSKCVLKTEKYKEE